MRIVLVKGLTGCLDCFFGSFLSVRASFPRRRILPATPAVRWRVPGWMS